MDYKLAKQLKDAGFPQNTRYASVKSPHFTAGERTLQIMAREKDNDGYANLLSAGYDIVSLPTLEELIEECVAFRRGFSLAFFPPDPLRHASAALKSAKLAFSNYSTPEEAVALLWLALHANGDATA
jgi:hypothetical protein